MVIRKISTNLSSGGTLSVPPPASILSSGVGCGCRGPVGGPPPPLLAGGESKRGSLTVQRDLRRRAAATHHTASGMNRNTSHNLQYSFGRR
jgi:hypothetical protein